MNHTVIDCVCVACGIDLYLLHVQITAGCVVISYDNIYIYILEDISM